MENKKFVIIRKWQEVLIWNNWLSHCTLKNIPMIKIYPKIKYSMIDWDYTSMSSKKLILDKNCKLIEDFFIWLWKEFKLIFSISCLNCTFEQVPNDVSNIIAVKIFDFLDNLK